MSSQGVRIWGRTHKTEANQPKNKEDEDAEFDSRECGCAGAVLRDVERDLEHAGQILCSVSGDVGPQLWHKINELINGVQGVIHQAYLLRPLE